MNEDRVMQAKARILKEYVFIDEETAEQIAKSILYDFETMLKNGEILPEYKLDVEGEDA